MKIVHITQDENFNSFISDLFEIVEPGNNLFVVRTYSSSKLRLQFPIRSKSRIVPPNILNIFRAWQDIRQADLLVLHSVSLFQALGAMLTTRKTRVLWSGWGYDYYDTGKMGPDSIFDGLTQRYLRETIRRNTFNWRLVLGSLIKEILKQKTARRSDYFSAPLRSDEAIFKTRYPKFRGSYHQIKYGTTDAFPEVGDLIPNPKRLLLGNSADYANNHLDAINFLAGFNLAGMEIIIPLSYGGSEQYIKLVTETAREKLNAHVVVLTDFLPAAEYSQILRSCSTMVLWHRRQQAMGTAIEALYNGVNLILRTESPFYQILIKLGVEVRSPDGVTRRSLSRPVLVGKKLAKQRALIDLEWSQEVVEKEVRDLMQEVRRELNNV